MDCSRSWNTNSATSWGYDHTDFGLMSPTLATGLRETPSAVIDAFLAEM